MSTTPTPERREIGNLLRGPRAASELASLLLPAAPELELDGSSLVHMDAYGAAVLRTAIEVHLDRHTSHTVSMIEPLNSECWALMSDLLGGPLPERCAWAGTRSTAKRGSYVLVPATPIADAEDVQLLVDHTVRQATGALGFGDRAGRLLQEAAAVFLDNAREHAADAPVAAVVSAMLDPQVNDLQLAAVSLSGVSRRQLPDEAAMRSAIANSRKGNRALTELVRTRAGLDFSLHLAWGAGRARYRTSQSWHFSTATQVPGFVSGIEVHR